MGHRAEQPEHQFLHGIGTGGEVQHQRQQCAGQRRDRQPGHDDDRRPRYRAGQPHQGDQRQARAQQPGGHRRVDTEKPQEVEIEHRGGGDRRALADADQRRIDQRIAQQALQRGPGQRHGGADQHRQQTARQAHLGDDQGGVAINAAQPVEQTAPDLDIHRAEMHRQPQAEAEQAGQQGIQSTFHRLSSSIRS